MGNELQTEEQEEREGEGQAETHPTHPSEAIGFSRPAASALSAARSAISRLGRPA